MITVQQSLLYALGAEFLARWGEERLRQAVPIRAWLEEAANISAGTDYPASPYDPMLGLWGMVTRDSQKFGVQGPEYAVDQYTTVQLYTAAGTQLIGESDRRGTLQAGRLADLVAFRADPITCPVATLLIHDSGWACRLRPRDGAWRAELRKQSLPGDSPGRLCFPTYRVTEEDFPFCNVTATQSLRAGP